MAIIKSLRGKTPVFGENCFLAENAVIIGNNVTIARGAIGHGYTLHDNVLVGMNAMIPDDVVIRTNDYFRKQLFTIINN